MTNPRGLDRLTIARYFVCVCLCSMRRATVQKLIEDARFEAPRQRIFGGISGV